MELERSIRARSAKSSFFEEINDVDIFIEDTAVGYEKILTTIFSRKFEGKYNVGKVFPLGSRKQVTKSYQESIEDISRPTLYVVDGDLFILSGDSVSNKNGFYKFPFYCFENLICDEDAFLDVLNEEECVLYREQISDKFDYASWSEKNIDNLFYLFIEYAIVMSLKPEIKTVSYGVRDLVCDGAGNTSVDKINARIEQLNNLVITEFGEEAYFSARQKILNEFISSS